MKGGTSMGWAVLRRRHIVVALVLAACTTACGTFGGNDAKSKWVDQPKQAPAEAHPQLPTPGGGQNSPGKPNKPGQPNQAADSSVVATQLDVPTGLVVLPDGTALVGERGSGRILRVQPKKAPVKLATRISGIDPGGDGGLLDLTLSPSYSEDRLIFAYITTPTDNRVIRFDLSGVQTPVFTGIPKGTEHNGGRIAFGTDGNIYVGTGDVGRPQQAQLPDNLAGKLLRITPFGKPAPGNPQPDSPVYASGFRNVTGLCFDDRKHLYATDLGDTTVDEVNMIEPGGNYGWPAVIGKSARPDNTNPQLTLPATQARPGGCAIAGFGLFVTAMDGARLWAAGLDTNGKFNGATPKDLLTNTYGRLRTVVAGSDGALWLTTSNRDGHGHPTADDDRVIRIMPPSGTANSPA